jgi:hypothetical protein
MGWFSVTTTIRSAQGVNVPFAFYVEDVETVDDLADVLAEDGVVVGDRYRVTNPRDGRKGLLSDRRRIMLTREGIASATEFGDLSDFRLRD